jgi:hypothetical protein
VRRGKKRGMERGERSKGDRRKEKRGMDSGERIKEKEKR